MLESIPEIRIEITGNRLYVECLTKSSEYTYQFSLFKDDMAITGILKSLVIRLSSKTLLSVFVLSVALIS